MKRPLLLALITSILFWLIFTGFSYLALLGRMDNAVHFSPFNFLRNLALVLAPWLCCGIASRWLAAEKYAHLSAALVYLLATFLAFYTSTRLRLPVYHNGHQVFGTNSIFMPPIEACYMFIFLFALTLTRALSQRKHK